MKSAVTTAVTGNLDATGFKAKAVAQANVWFMRWSIDALTTRQTAVTGADKDAQDATLTVLGRVLTARTAEKNARQQWLTAATAE